MPDKALREFVGDWLASLLAREDFSLRQTPLAESREWALRDGGIHHVTGRFFSVVGICGIDPEGRRIAQPLLDQREVGILALIVRQHAGSTEVLVQAKAEPGNVNTFQLAPSCQATASNLARMHGGDLPPMAEWFSGAGRGRYVANGLHSEQGSRFYGKRNRNCTLLIEGEVGYGDYHAWLPVRSLCRLLADDHLVNTDLRSTLVCSDWALLAGGEPFAGSGFAEVLRNSSGLPDAQAWMSLEAIVEMLRQPAAWLETPALCPVESLAGWHFGESGPEPLAGFPFRLRHIQVQSRSREVHAWDQPIIESTGMGIVGLPMAYRAGVPFFLFRRVTELGYGDRCELTPAITCEPGMPFVQDSFTGGEWQTGRDVAVCVQSEEGGRFLFDQNRYVIRDIGMLFDPPEEHYWLSLAQIRCLLAMGESLTNEARSALSLLLRWL